jgi:archaellum biogenesis ATPase FlaH
MIGAFATEFERRLSEFVDRDAEMKRFQALLDGDQKLAMVVTGGGGIGKSSLMARMVHEVSLRELTKVEIIYTEDNIHEYVSILRKCRDDIGATHFSAFTDLLNYFTVENYTLNVNLQGANVNVAQGMTVTNGASVGTIAAVVIKDSMITFPRSDLDVSEGERRSSLTHRFLQDLAAVAATRKQIVVFFDATEKMSEMTARWLWKTLLTGILDARIFNVRVIMLGRETPEIDRMQKPLVEIAELMPLAIDDIVAYMEKRGVGPDHRRPLAELLFVTTKGNPLAIGNYVDGFLELQEKKS